MITLDGLASCNASTELLEPRGRSILGRRSAEERHAKKMSHAT